MCNDEEYLFNNGRLNYNLKVGAHIYYVYLILKSEVKPFCNYIIAKETLLDTVNSILTECLIGKETMEVLFCVTEQQIGAFVTLLNLSVTAERIAEELHHAFPPNYHVLGFNQFMQVHERKDGKPIGA